MRAVFTVSKLESLATKCRMTAANEPRLPGGDRGFIGLSSPGRE
jgi:hypothetical protein